MTLPPKPGAFAVTPQGVASPMHAPHAKGYLGEQTAGFVLGQKGYVVLDGPSGSAGHGITTPGLDGAAFNPKTDDLLIYDNKSFKRGGNVGSASAITRNLPQNLDSLIQRLSAGRASLPRDAALILDRALLRLRAARQSLSGAGSWPKNCRLAVTAEAGHSTGVGGNLGARGVVFVDIARDL
jgi:hypothetical protein